MNLSFRKILLATALATASAGVSQAAIVRLNLTEMVAQTDNAVQGTIVDRQVFRVDHPVDGEMYYTVITVEGRSLIDGQAISVPVTYLGGFVSETEGTFVSEAPREQLTRVGRQVLVFYKWADNMGFGIQGNSLYASHGGVYSIAKSGSKSVVLGRGDGYAVAANEELPGLTARVADIAREVGHSRATK